jgi:hypothetical protein
MNFGQAAESNFHVYISFCYSAFAVAGLAPQFPSDRQITYFILKAAHKNVAFERQVVDVYCVFYVSHSPHFMAVTKKNIPALA